MKNNNHYKTELTLNDERLQYLFVSEGNSTIIKVIEYSPITTFGERVVYNLGFGDYDEISKTILDDTDSNNGDMYVVFNTVLFTVPLFFTSKPDCVIYVCGSDSDEEFKEISNAFNGRENGYLTNGLDSRDNYYMKRVYLACVRGIDFLTSLPEWDGKNVIAQGGSQGGALALITAGLDERVTACVANHPALSDMAGYKAGRAGGYPHFFRNSVDMDTPEKIKTMAYYDVVNFAKLIKADTYITWGFNDDTCPPTTSYIVYNVLNCPKEALITPINEHWTSNDTEYGHLLWIKKHLK